MKINFIKSIVTKSIIVENKEDRIFTGIATAEMVDKQGEITSRDALLEQFPTWMKRGGPIMDTHSNRHVGKGLNFSPIEVVDPNSDKSYYGIKITAQIFKDNKLDDEIWKYITDGTYKGLSFGGANRSNREPIQQADGSLAYKLNDLELYEMSVCPEPAVPLAVITDFNNLAKSLTSDQLSSMDIEERADNQVIVKCSTVKCYVMSGNPEAHLENKTIIPPSEDETDKNKATVNVITGKSTKKSNNMNKKDEEEDSKKEDESEEDDDDKSSKSKEEETISEEDDKDKSIGKLADLVGKFVSQTTKSNQRTEKRFADLEKKIDKALEAPSPAQENTNNSEVKLNNTYNDGGGDSQGSEEPEDADAEGTDDKVQIEEKTEQVIATLKADESWTSTRRSGQSHTQNNVPEGNAVLMKARELGAQGLGELANLVNKGEMGAVQDSSYGSGYPQV